MSKILEGNAAVDCLDLGDGLGRAVLRCPSCGEGLTHIVRVGTLMGSDASEAEVYPGTEVIGKTGERRSALSVVCSCENCPKLFAAVLQQCKGENWLQIHADVEIPPGANLASC